MSVKLAGAWVLVVLLAMGLAGCGSGSDSGSSDGGASMDQMAAQLDAQDAARQQEKAAAEKKAQDEAAAAAAATTQTAAEPDRKVAGRDRVGGGGYYTAIVGARRHVLNRVDDLAWLQGVQHFQATEGRLPKDHAEFMSKIVEPLGIDLGFKEENQEFLYDPKEGQWGEVYVVEKLDEPAQQ